MMQRQSFSARIWRRARQGVFVVVAVLSVACLGGLPLCAAESEAGSTGEESQVIGAVVLRHELNRARGSRGHECNAVLRGPASQKPVSVAEPPSGPSLAFRSYGGLAATLPLLC